MNTNQTNTLVVKHYDNTYQVCVDLGAYVRANAPDQKSRDKVRNVVESHCHMLYARDLLCSLHGAFDGLSKRAYYKAAGRDKPEHDKHTNRADFYRDISQWARACYVMGKEAPVITPNIDAHSSGPQFDALEKDAEDDSDPYVKPSSMTDPMEQALTQLKDRLTLADFSKQRIDAVLDILERFGDEASELSWGGEYEAERFWDACVQISDDLRSDMAADQLKKASTIKP